MKYWIQKFSWNDKYVYLKSIFWVCDSELNFYVVLFETAFTLKKNFLKKKKKKKKKKERKRKSN